MALHKDLHEALQSAGLQLSDVVASDTIDDAIRFFSDGRRQSLLLNVGDVENCPVAYYFTKRLQTAVRCSYYGVHAYIEGEESDYIPLEPDHWTRLLQDHGFKTFTTDSYGLPCSTLTSHAIVDVLERIKAAA